MANIKIAGASYSDVPSIEVPKVGENAGNVSFYDTEDADISANDIILGKKAYGANGPLIGMYDPSGGGEDLLEKSLLCQIVDYTNENLTSLPNYAFYYNNTAPQNLKLPNCTSIGTSAFRYSGSLRTFFGPKAGLNASPFYGAAKMTVCVACGYLGSINTNADLFMKYGTPHLLNTVDLVLKKNGLPKRTFYNCDNFTTLILREEAIYPLGDVNAFYQTPFDSGGSGGTIYIPKALYDHLGDNSSLDYKAATNWSTINGYGTITWVKIEGSIYETQYADGTPISS